MIQLAEKEKHVKSIGSWTKSLGIGQLQCLQLFWIRETSPESEAEDDVDGK